MKFGKLAVSLTAAAVMGAFGPAFAQSYSSDSGVGMRNTDANAPSVTNRDVMSSQPQPNDPSTPQTGSSSSIESQSSGRFTGGSEMAWIAITMILPRGWDSPGVPRTNGPFVPGSVYFLYRIFRQFILMCHEILPGHAKAARTTVSPV